jgi:uncharacterized lipoprotein YmbA
MRKRYSCLALAALLSGCASSTTNHYYTVSGDSNSIVCTDTASTERPVRVDTGVSAAASAAASQNGNAELNGDTRAEGRQ